MADNTKIVLNYLSSEKIHIDEKEFEYQLNSHPDYPSLLAISDTLSFFRIENAAVRVVKENFELLPDRFIASLRSSKGEYLSIIQKNGEQISYTDIDNASTESLTNKTDFFTIWDGIVLLAERDDLDAKVKKRAKLLWLPYLILAVLAIAVLSLIGLEHYTDVLFGIFPIMGIWLSIYALNDIFQTDSKILSKVCESSPSSNCGAIVGSNKWKIFDTLNFSDASILFFSIQLISLFAFGLVGQYAEFYALQTVLLGLSIPVIIASLYYQKFVEKKWCPICLLIISVLVIEMGYIVIFTDVTTLSITIMSSLLMALISVLVYSIWFPLKRLLTENKRLKEADVKANRFKRNYTLFKNTFLSAKSNTMPNSLLKFGHTNAKTKITLLTSPFCSFCERPHRILKELLETFRDTIEVSMLFNVSENDDRYKAFARNLVQQTLINGQQAYYEAMDDWYRHKDIEAWLQRFKMETIDDKIEVSLREQHTWCTKHNYNFTPCLFVNGRKFPDLYDVDDLQFFIEELSEDSDLDT